MRFVNTIYRSSNFENDVAGGKDVFLRTMTYLSPHLILVYICLMQVNDALIDKLSRLAMLDFDAAEREEIKDDLEKMIRFVDKLKELDTTGVEPLLHITTEINVLRNDTPGNMLTKVEALQNAPQHNGDFFLVPKVIKKDEA